MQHKSIKTPEQFYAVTRRIEQLIDASAGSDGAKELKLLSEMIKEQANNNQVASPEQVKLA